MHYAYFSYDYFFTASLFCRASQLDTLTMTSRRPEYGNTISHNDAATDYVY